YHKYIGGNFRLDPIQAAVLLVKLRYLDSWSEARRRNAARYDRLFAGSSVITPHINPECVSIFNQYVVQVDNRDEVLKALSEACISTEIYYPLPLHLQECFASIVPAGLRLAASENSARRVLALPIYPELAVNMVDCVAETVINVSSHLQST